MPQDMLELMNNKLIDIIARLERIEQRQIRTTKIVEEVEKEQPVVGSFGTVNHGEEKK